MKTVNDAPRNLAPHCKAASMTQDQLLKEYYAIWDLFKQQEAELAKVSVERDKWASTVNRLVVKVRALEDLCFLHLQDGQYEREMLRRQEVGL